MNAVTGFVAGLVITMGVVLVAIVYLRQPLQLILSDLCGSADRARFWTAFCNITLFLVPLVFALNHQPDSSSGQATIFMISSQIEFALIGLVMSVVTLGFILCRYIPKTNAGHASSKSEVR